MTLIEFFAAAVIAFYAMLGGALLNAAITSPRNCLIAISGAWNEVLTWFFFVWACLVIILVFGAVSTFDLALVPIIVMCSAHTATFIILLLARTIAEAIIEKHHGDDHCRHQTEEPNTDDDAL